MYQMYHSQLLLQRVFLIPGRILDGPSFARPDNNHVPSQHRLPSQERNFIILKGQMAGNINHTSLENQKFWGNCRNILVYVAITIPLIASCLNSEDSLSDARNKER